VNGVKYSTKRGMLLCAKPGQNRRSDFPVRCSYIRIPAGRDADVEKLLRLLPDCTYLTDEVEIEDLMALFARLKITNRGVQKVIRFLAPTAFGVTECQGATEEGLYPALSRGGIQVMSINLLLDDSTAPVVWRGPVIAGAVKQFWTDVIWEDVDYMFVDMPPGTGDVPLTVFQSLPVDGIVIVTSPQDLVSMIVSKAVKMANMMHIPVLGFVENYSYLQCPDCGKKIEVFGKSKLDEVAAQFGLPVLARLPIDPKVAECYDSGLMESVDTAAMAEVVNAVENA
jgi:hypothetical protein